MPCARGNHYNNLAMQAAVTAYQRGFGATPAFLRSGGSIPVVNTLQTLLKVPTVLMGFALPDDRNHAPNERFHLDQFYGEIATCIAFLAALGKDARLAHDHRLSLSRRPG